MTATTVQAVQFIADMAGCRPSAVVQHFVEEAEPTAGHPRALFEAVLALAGEDGPQAEEALNRFRAWRDKEEADFPDWLIDLLRDEKRGNIDSKTRDILVDAHLVLERTNEP